jgi:hypothetical protein
MPNNKATDFLTSTSYVFRLAWKPTDNNEAQAQPALVKKQEAITCRLD